MHEAGSAFNIVGLDPAHVLDIDIMGEDLRQNFMPTLFEWAKRPPFYVMTGGAPQMICARYKDVMEVYSGQLRFTSEAPKSPGRFDRFMGIEALTQLDGARHDRLRRLMNPAFSPAAIERLSGVIVGVVDALLGEIKDKGMEFDAMGDFASHLVMRILLGGMLKMSAEQQRVFLAANKAIATITHLKPGEAPPSECIEAFENARNLVKAIIDQRRMHPGDDLISVLILAREAGDQLSDTELFDQIFVICAAALTSTASAMAGALLCLGKHPDQFDEVKRDFSLIPLAVEECLRLHGPGFLSFVRFAREDTQIGGVVAPKGIPIICSQQAACYDAEQFPDPLRFDIRRNPKGIAIFGGGIHHCLGNRLARFIIQTGLRRLVETFPKLRLADPDFKPVYHGEVSETMLTALPMRVA